MEWYLLLAVVFLCLLALLAAGLPIAVSLGLISVVWFFVTQGTRGVGLLALTGWSTTHNFVMLTVPLFILMAEVLAFTGTVKKLYDAMESWFGTLPGGLLMSSMVSCAGFAAMCGSSTATAATIGLMAIPESVDRGYDKRLVTGSIAAGGCLGILIPPSLSMIFYSIVTETSVGKLFIAGIVPGIMLTLIMMSYLFVRVKMNPRLAPAAPAVDWRRRVRVLRGIWAPLVVILGVIASIYGGISTPTEAAAVGTFLAMLIGIQQRTLTWGELRPALLRTVEVSGFMIFIIVGAMVFGNLLALLGVSAGLTSFVTSLAVSPWVLVLAMMGILLVLGCFLDIASIVLIFVPLFFPVVTGLGFDPIWFGILVVVNMEIASITPPVGMNTFVIAGVAKRFGVSLQDVFVGAGPFVGLYLAGMGLVMLFPQLALWLPGTMK